MSPLADWCLRATLLVAGWLLAFPTFAEMTLVKDDERNLWTYKLEVTRADE